MMGSTFEQYQAVEVTVQELVEDSTYVDWWWVGVMADGSVVIELYFDRHSSRKTVYTDGTHAYTYDGIREC